MEKKRDVSYCGLKEAIEQVESNPEMKKLPGPLRNLIRMQLESAGKIDFPVATFKEEGWVVAQTPVMDLCAQGRTEEEAIESLKAMISDWMADPDTQKPEIKAMINMELTLRTIPINILVGYGDDVGKVECPAKG